MTLFFAVCFLVGLGMSVVSFVSGMHHHADWFEHLFHTHGHAHVHVPHATYGHVPHGVPGHAPQAHGANVVKAGAPVHTAHLDDVSVSPLNAAVLTAFLAWFGGAGLLAQQFTPWSLLPVLLVAFAVGAIGGEVIRRFLTLLVRRETPVQPLSMVGTIAMVTIPIRAQDGTGEIVFTHQGTRQVAGARSDNGHAVAKGAEVIVTRYEKGIAYVATWDELSAMTPKSE